MSSQAGQDQWVIDQFSGMRGGSFLDVGAGHHESLSNTVRLEREYGWKGIACEIAPVFDAKARPHTRLVGDFFSQEWLALTAPYTRDGRDAIDYLSIDLEPPELTVNALACLLGIGIRFLSITAEHDLYRAGGPHRKAVMASMLRAHGYRCARENVAVRVEGNEQGLPFEDWWNGVAPDYIR